MRVSGVETKQVLRRATFALYGIMIFTPPAHGFFRNMCADSIAMARIDPIVSRGKPSQHLHQLNGGSNMNFDATGESLSSSNCTNSIVTQDKSGYWAPYMYFQHESGKFEEVTMALGLTIYYKYENRPSSGPGSIVPFPKGFRMLAGNPTKRTWNGPWPVPDQSNWGPADTTQAALAEKSIGFNCMSYFRGQKDEGSFEHPWIRDKNFTDTMCDDGLRAELIFPSCWDGKNLDSADHKSHVAYPSIIQDGLCPPTHPVKLPIVFFETIYNTQSFKNSPGRYVMSNGDPTGYGYHADFVASWDDGVQEAVIADESCTGPSMLSGHVEDCGVFRGRVQSLADAATCKIEIPEALRNEQVTGLMDTLPGNMQVTGIRHDPGTRPEQVTQASVSATAGTRLSTDPMIEPSPFTNAVASLSSSAPEVSSAAVPPPSIHIAPVSVITSTSTYTTSNYVVEMIIIEEIDTVTVTTNAVMTQTIIADGDNTVPTTTAAPLSVSAVASPTGTDQTLHRRRDHRRRHLRHNHSHGHLRI